MWNAGLDETHAGIKIAGRSINNLRYVDDTTLKAESKEKLESLDQSGRGMWKNQLKIRRVFQLSIQKMKIMASSPITSWQIDGETIETVTDFVLGGLQMVTAAMKLKDVCSLEEKLWPT